MTNGIAFVSQRLVVNSQAKGAKREADHYAPYAKALEILLHLLLAAFLLILVHTAMLRSASAFVDRISHAIKTLAG